jgi:CRP-like cAMP-binding protein
MPDTEVPRQNHLLAALPEDEYGNLSPYLERVHMQPGEILYEAGCQFQHVYFPTTAIVSLLYVMENGASVETAGIGNDGMTGIALIMGGDTMPNRAMVLCAGYAYRLKSRLLMDEFNRAGGRRTGALRQILLRYTQALITQMSQTAVCNRYHSMEQQLCRWLLSCLDRLPSNELMMTQEAIANVLGVRREGITAAAGRLQNAGLIHYRRGHITVIDRSGLERLACECYQTVKAEFGRLLPYTIETHARPFACRHSTRVSSGDRRPRRARAAPSFQMK